MRTLLSSILGLIALAAAQPAAAGADPAPQRIVSINLCTDLVLLALDIPDRIAALSWLAADPSHSVAAGQAADFPLVEANAEAVLAYQPDLVLAGAHVATPTVSLLRRLGVRVEVFLLPDGIAGLRDLTHAIGRVVGASEKAARLTGAMTRRLAAFENRFAGLDADALVIRARGATVGRPSPEDDIIRLLGMRNIAARRGIGPWGVMSLEAIIGSRPDVILLAIPDPDQASLAQDFLNHRALGALLATARTAHLPGEGWSCSPLHLADGVAELVGHVAAGAGR